MSTYLKVAKVTYNSGTDTVNLITRTFSDVVPNTGGIVPISISYNGQEIPLRTVETASTFAKFYYEIVSNSYPSAGLTLNFIANAAYSDPGYTSGSVACSFSSQDIIFVEYTYEV